MSEQKNMILFILILVGIMGGWQYFYEGPRAEHAKQVAMAKKAEDKNIAAAAPEAPAIPAVPLAREQVISASARVTIHTPSLVGSINLQGGIVDDLILKKYHQTTAKDSPEVVLLQPAGTKTPYFASFGWSVSDKTITVPDYNTVWTTDREDLTQTSGPVKLSWTNPQGIIFERLISVDENYMFTIEQRVTNGSSQNVQLVPYAQINRIGTPHLDGYVQEGPLGYMNDKLHTYQYEKLKEQPAQKTDSTGGWVGITDKYWLTALIPDQKTKSAFYVEDKKIGAQDDYTTGFQGEPITVAPGQTTTVQSHLFAGAKVLNLLDAYEDKIGIKHFDLAVDFGWFYLITKPMFYILLWIYHLVGNLGVAILLLTILVKIAFFPLANKQYRSMGRMKELTPKIEKIRERYADDKLKMNQEMMDLYKREKVNPASGCLPILIQLPVFISLYNVLSLSIEMRQAPFFGWIHDLSAPDPTSLFNLFGLIPWDPPSLLMIGVLPIIMGLSMWIQQRMSPTPMDPAQQQVFMFMPVIMTVLFAQFPAGLVLYWTANNVLSIAQQWLIMNNSERTKRKAAA